MNAANIINTFEIIASEVLKILTAPLDILLPKSFIIVLNVDVKSVSSIDKFNSNSPDSSLVTNAIMLLNKLESCPSNTVVTKYTTREITESIINTIRVTPAHLGILLSIIFTKNGCIAYAIANAIKNGIVILTAFLVFYPKMEMFYILKIQLMQVRRYLLI